jgi:F-type H+-transporting ATPase subunit b
VIASSNFLVPNGTFVVEVVAFLAVLFVLWRYVLPPINRAMEKRQEEIRASLEAAERARAEADETRAQRQGILDEARGRAREIVANANANAERLKAEAESQGRQEYERLIASAETEIALARQRAIDDVSVQLGSMVLSVARQVIGREIDAEAHRGLIDEAVAALRSSAGTASAGTAAAGRN